MKRFEPPHDKINNVAVRPVKTRISLGIAQSDQSLRCPHEESIRPGWSESSLGTQSFCYEAAHLLCKHILGSSCSFGIELIKLIGKEWLQQDLTFFYFPEQWGHLKFSFHEQHDSWLSCPNQISWWGLCKASHLIIFTNSVNKLTNQWMFSVLIFSGVLICYSCRLLFSHCLQWLRKFWRIGDYMRHVVRKPVFGVCDQVKLKPACSATGTS